MEIFWSELRGAESAVPRREGRSKSPGSAFAWSLLAFAVRTVWGCELPETTVLPGGKPYFPGREDMHFSLSHTKSAVLVAVSACRVGADVETRRDAVRPALEKSLFSVPHGDLDLFELWTLRESWFKLTGRGDLRSIPFSRTEGVITGPEPGLYARLYDEIPGCAAAVCSFDEAPPERIHRVELNAISLA